MTLAEALEWVQHAMPWASLVGLAAQHVRSKQRLREATDDVVVRTLAREAKLSDRVEVLETDLGECRAGREQQDERLACLERTASDAVDQLIAMRGRLDRWARSLANVGVDAEDSDERDAQLGRVLAGYAANEAERERLRAITEVDARKGEVGS